MANLNKLQQQRQQILNEIQRRGGRGKATGYEKQLQGIEQQLRQSRNPQQPASQAPVQPAPATQPNPMSDVTAGLGGGESSSRDFAPYGGAGDYMVSPMSAEMFKGMENYEGSPYYNWRKQKGMGDLEKLMSARGLTKSGAEIQANSDFLSQVGADESQRMRDDNYRWTSMGADLQSRNADRAFNESTANSDADFRNRQLYSDNMFKGLGLALGQDPSALGYSAGSAMSDAMMAKGKAGQAVQTGIYNKPTQGIVPRATGGGGGGGGSYPGYVAPYPTNTSQMPYASAIAGSSNATGWGNFIQGLGGIFGSNNMGF
jgi:hypothetical protein